jgi:SAM-dependent methyltransferase
VRLSESIAVMLGGFVVAAALQLPVARGDEAASPYVRIPATADGIGKSYMGREITQVMGWQGAAWLERPEREEQERSDLLLSLLEVGRGAAVADIGAGSGYYTERLARAVGSAGVVYAVDVQPEMIALLRDRAKRSGLGNVRPVLADVKDVRLPAASIDLAMMVDVYHELEYPVEVLASLVRAVRPGGRVVFVEYRAEDERVPIKPLHKMSETQIRAEAGRQSLAWEQTLTALPWQHVVIFRRLPP